jgi:hypothetical protein
MSLPILSTPKFEACIPSTGQTISFRPFLVREEKILYIALESRNEAEVIKAVKQILGACIHDEINVDDLTSFDFEYLFLQLRGKSVGETIDLTIKHDSEKTDCKHKTPVSINIDLIKVDMPEKIANVIKLTDTIGLTLKYPNIHTITRLSSKKMTDVERVYEIVPSCIESIYSGDDVITDFTKEELNEWIMSMNQKQFASVITFFNNIPFVSHTVEWTCSKCMTPDSVVIKGLQSFFT